MSEQQLSGWMRDSLAGDAGAYRMLLDALSRLLRGYFAKRMGSQGAADVEDLVQDTLMAVHVHRATYEPGRPLTAWVHAIARYKLIDHLRRRRTRAAVPLDGLEDFLAADDPDVSVRLDVESLLETVPERQRALIRQTRLEGRSIAEVAAAAGQSESAVKVSIHRGLKALATRLGRR